jgi:Tol biopolymer transport system component
MTSIQPELWVDAPTEAVAFYEAACVRRESGMKALTKSGTAVEPTWFPDGRHILFNQYKRGPVGREMVISADGTGLRPAGIPGPGGNTCVLPDNKQIALLRPKARDGDPLSAIFVAGLYGHGLKRITPWGSYADKIDCSPNGQRIVFSKPAFSQGGLSSNVYTMRIDGTDLVQLTHDKGGTINDGADSWSPDGTKIAYVSNKTGTYQIWTMNADGSEQTQLTKGKEAHRAAWGPIRSETAALDQGVAFAAGEGQRPGFAAATHSPHSMPEISPSSDRSPRLRQPTHRLRALEVGIRDQAVAFRSDNKRWSLDGAPWMQPAATRRNRWPQKQSKSSQNRCCRLRPVANRSAW